MKEKAKKSFPYFVFVVFCFAVIFGFYFQEIKADQATTTVTVGNVVPVVSGVSLNAGSNISPTENTIVSVNITGKVTDDNGWATISNITAQAFRSGKAINCSAGDNDCYTGISCSSSGSGTVASVTCATSLWFHLDPTDSGTYAAEEWVGAILATDSSSATHEDTSEVSENVDVIGTLCLDVASSIAYGTVAAGNDTGATNKTTLVSNTCNTAIDTLVSGTALTSAAANGTIVVGNQHYDLTAFTYGGTETVLTGSNAQVEIVCAKPTSHAPSNSSDDVFWGIAVTAGTPIGTDYGGADTFTATND